MTVLPQGSEISRRRLLQFGAAAGFLLGTGSLAGCAGPTGLPGPQHPDPGPQPVPGQPGQQAQPVRRRRHRPARRPPGPHRHRPRNQARPGPGGTLRDDRPHRMDRHGSAKASATRTARPVQIEDVATALKMYQQVQGSFVAGFFPEFPDVVPVDDRTFRMESKKPIPILDSLMSMILITPAAQNKPEELQEGVGTGPYVVTKFNRGAGTYSLATQRELLGPGARGGQRGSPVPPRGIQPRHRPAQRRGGHHRLHHARLARTARRTSRRRARRGLQPPPEPDLLQLPQARRPSAGRCPRPRGPQLGHRRRGAGQGRAGGLRQRRPRASPRPASPATTRPAPTPTIRRRPRPGSPSSASRTSP